VTNPKCFISYSWDSDQHKAWTRSLAEKLHRNGVYVHLDQWDVKLGHDLPRYMETCIRESQFVLLICTPNFAEKANKGTGGVGYEKSIVTGEIFQAAPSATKFVPLLRSGDPTQSIPSYLRSRAYVDVRDDLNFESAIDQLLRHIHDAPESVRPPLGAKPAFSPKDNQDLVSTSVPARMSAKTEAKKTAAERLPAPEARLPAPVFEVDRFKELFEFAYSTGGLDLAREVARQWAMDRVAENSSFDVERFEELFTFGYSTDGLDLTREAAREWAMDRVNEKSSFDVERFEELFTFAYSTGGLDLPREAAKQWAMDRVNEKSSFDVERLEELFTFAYSTDGLNLTREAARQWAMERLTSK
jgi:hypothetical protein